MNNLFVQLCSMGFDAFQVQEALENTNNAGLQQALDYICNKNLMAQFSQ
jgi:hypothetical protein